jgi:hypothetical protein
MTPSNPQRPPPLPAPAGLAMQEDRAAEADLATGNGGPVRLASASGWREAGTHDAAGAVAAVFTMDNLDRLTQRLSMAGLRLASLRRRLAGVEDRIMLIQASDDLDEAIAEVRRIALMARQAAQG